MEGICAGLLWEGLIALILRLTCRSGDVPRRYRGAGIGVNSPFSTWWHWLLTGLTGVHECWWANGENGITLLSSWSRKFVPSQTHDQSPLLCLRLQSASHLHSVSQLSTCQVAPPSRVLFQTWLCFKTPHFRDPYGSDPVWFSREGSCLWSGYWLWRVFC